VEVVGPEGPVVGDIVTTLLAAKVTQILRNGWVEVIDEDGYSHEVPGHTLRRAHAPFQERFERKEARRTGRAPPAPPPPPPPPGRPAGPEYVPESPEPPRGPRFHAPRERDLGRRERQARRDMKRRGF